MVFYIKAQPPLYVDFDALSLRHVTSSFALTTHVLTETLFNRFHFMLQFDLNEGKGKWTSDGLVPVLVRQGQMYQSKWFVIHFLLN